MSVAAIGLTYGGTSLQENPMGLHLEFVRGLDEVPEVRGTDITIPHTEWQSARNRLYHARPILLEGYLAGIGVDETAQQADYRERVLELFTGASPLFDPRVRRDLVATLEDGSIATVSARTIDTP
ncbi:MAG TPA: hypothetical protein VGK41_09390, partial [Solirubrobacterales bacterium]